MKVIQGVNAKLIIIGVLILVILIPMTMIESLILERQERKAEAVLDVTSKWGENQVITGPIITIPYKTYSRTSATGESETLHYRHFLPENLKIEGNLTSERRERGIYEVVLYKSQLSIKGHFADNLLSQFSVPEGDVMTDDAVISLGISDMGGIQKRVKASFANHNITIEPGLTTKDVFSEGVHSKSIDLRRQTPYRFDFKLDINGSESLSFVPVAEENSVHLKSDWKTPSFEGAFLPKSRNIGNEGFSSEWRVLNLNRNYPQSWDGAEHQVNSSAFGVNLYIASDLYKKSTRAIKYALLFVVFTFAAFFCIELFNDNKIHPFQYLLVGLAISIFYILLLSISEHTNFNISYMISSIATILLIGLYTRSVFKQSRLSMVIMGLLAILYTYLYILMQLEDVALLIGSIGLFTGLASIMFITRKIDWYQISESHPKQEAD